MCERSSESSWDVYIMGKKMDFKNVLNQINLLKFHFHQLFQVPLCLFTCFPFLVNTEVAFGDPNPGTMNYME